MKHLASYLYCSLTVVKLMSFFSSNPYIKHYHSIVEAKNPAWEKTVSYTMARFHLPALQQPSTIDTTIDFSINGLSTENCLRSQRTPKPYKIKVNNCKLIYLVIRIELTRFILMLRFSKFLRNSIINFRIFLFLGTYFLRVTVSLLLLLLLLLEKVGNARLGESDQHPISPKTPTPQHQPIE